MQHSPSPLLIPTLAAANFAVGVGSFITIGVLTPMSADLNMTAAEAGFVMTVYAIAYAIGSPLMVAATGSWARRSVLCGGLLLMGLSSVISALAETPDILFISRAIAALGGGVITPVVAGVAAANSPPEKRGSAMAMTFFGLSFAQVLGMPACAWIGYTYGWQVSFWVATGLALAAALLVFTVIPAKTAFQVNSLNTLVAALGDLKSVFAILLTSTMMGSMYIVFTYIAPIIERGMGFGRDGVSLFLMIFGIGGIIGSLIGGKMVDRFGPVRCVAVIIATQIAFQPMFSLLPMPVFAFFSIGIVGAAFGWAFMVPQQLRLITMAPERQAVTLALNAAAIYLGASIGSAIGAVVVETWGMQYLGFAAGFGAFLALCHFLLSERWLKA